MADTKISALTALTGANVDAAADFLAIVDTSVTTTKKILVSELFTSPTFTTSLIAASPTMALLNTVATTVNAFGAATALNFGGNTTTWTPTTGTTFTHVTATATTLNLFNTVATTVNFAGAGTTVSIGADTGTTTVNNALVADSLSTGSGAISGGGVILETSAYGARTASVGRIGNDTNANDIGSIFLQPGTTTGEVVVYNAGVTARILTLSQTAGANRINDGIRIGADSTNNLLDDASTGGGTATLYIGNAAITVASDVRLKANIIDTQRDAIGIFNKLRVVDHTWNDPSDKATNNRNSRGVWTGLIAQEADAHIPWIVNRPRGDDPDFMWHMDLDYMAPLFVKGFQQVDARQNDHEARLRALELNQ